MHGKKVNSKKNKKKTAIYNSIDISTYSCENRVRVGNDGFSFFSFSANINKTVNKCCIGLKP